jgi:hypothetical protein
VLAEVDGEIRAALSLRDGSATADPFFPRLTSSLCSALTPLPAPRLQAGAGARTAAGTGGAASRSASRSHWTPG